MPAQATGFRAFVVLWIGQFVSLTASAVSSFAVGVYCYLSTGSVMTLALLYALPFIPFLIVSPFAGTVADRWGAKRALLVSNIGCMIVALAMTALLWTGTFAVWQVYPIVAVTGSLRALELPAFEAALPLLVPQAKIGQATGMRMLATAVSSLAGPVVAGALLPAIGIKSIVALNCASFLFAIVSLLVLRIPRLPLRETATGGSRATVLADARAGWRYLTVRPGLISLAVLLGVLSFGVGFGELVLSPLVLAFAQPSGLGLVLSVGALGMVVVSGLISVWSWPKPDQRVQSIVGALFLFAGSIILASLRPSLLLLAVAVFLFMGSTTFVIGVIQTIWQVKVEPQMLGRTAALRNALSVTPQLFGNLLAGPLCAFVAVPLVGAERVRSHAVSLLVGAGPGRGYALSLTALGLATALFVAFFARTSRLRRLDDELPDVPISPSLGGSLEDLMR